MERSTDPRMAGTGWGVLAWLVALSAGSCLAADPFWAADPAWSLIHEPAVAQDLKLTAAQSRELRVLLDAIDARVFPLRNQPADVAGKGVSEALAELAERLQSLLSPAQLRRLTELHARQQGTEALLRPALAVPMEYTPRQAEQLEEVISTTLAASRDLQRRVAAGEPLDGLEKEHAALKQDELDSVVRILTPRQSALWRRSLGRDFDLARIGQPRYRAPELVDTGDWLNSEPLSLESLRGKVVVLHFYAFGCINCVRNFPTYLEWQKRFHDEDVVIVGIHTPETAAEHDAASVRTRAAEAAFTFPILIDSSKANWNAWGNSMWPSVYLVDRRGYLRYFWPGELKWQGATGDVWMRERIADLLAEPAHRYAP